MTNWRTVQRIRIILEESGSYSEKHDVLTVFCVASELYIGTLFLKLFSMVSENRIYFKIQWQFSIFMNYFKFSSRRASNEMELFFLL